MEPQADLQELFGLASQATPSDRIGYRDAIARHGSAAVPLLEAWLTDPRLGAFAVRTLGKVAAIDREAAVAALRRGLTQDLSEPIHRDTDAELERLGARRRPAAGQRPPTRIGQQPRMSVDDLVRGEVYRRQDLHARGLGGNPQKGISYPAYGDHVLLFSNPNRIHETGYRDRWEGEGRYLYFGEWSGSGDMRMEGGNQKVIERSPALHLLVGTGPEYRYQGRFQYISHRPEPTARDGVPGLAIVFELLGPLP